MNGGHVTILVLLDLSAAFDIVDLLLQKLPSVIGMQGTIDPLLVSIVFRE